MPEMSIMGEDIGNKELELKQGKNEINIAPESLEDEG